MRMTMAENLRSSLPMTEKVREFIKKIKERSRSILADKSTVEA